jgi:hypothetical protein
MICIRRENHLETKIFPNHAEEENNAQLKMRPESQSE